jgi:light-regulated signal transduction histidine kinase (bacteriophytochrome)
MIRQVWANLVENAVKYSRHASPARITISCTLSEGENPEHVFCVRDNGVGFDSAYVGKLFGVFQRLHDASQFEGTGIGLANVRRIVERHGGRTWAEGSVGKGAAFFFSLPINRPASRT